MIAQFKDSPKDLPSIRVDVVERRTRARKNWLQCMIGENLRFTTESLESYFFAQWEPVVYDALLVAAAAEFCDRTQHRFARLWARDISLRVPVHNPDHWNQKDVCESLHDALQFLTGDRWHIEFCARSEAEAPPRQGTISLPSNVKAVIPFSNGLDSRAVAGLVAQSLGDSLVCVRLGSLDFDDRARSGNRQPFTAVPYKVQEADQPFTESTARSRGFKFALISGLAAYLAKAGEVIVPESGQGALGPALVPVGQAYVDYRSHPLFTGRMERFLAALLGYKVSYRFPQLWQTKGETLAAYVAACKEGTASWRQTWSCWQQSRHVSVDGKKRQCGICAACMLRRLSVHAAGFSEPKEKYVWEDLGAFQFNTGATPAFDRRKITPAMREYAIAGALHLDHLADLHHAPGSSATLELSAFELGRACGLTESEARIRLMRLLSQHETEWKNFMGSLGSNSFVTDWTESVS